MLSVALLQMEPKADDLEYNRKRAAEMIDEAISSGKNPQLLVLPETWTSPFSSTGDLMTQVEKYSETIEGPSMQMLREKAKQYKVWIVSGSFPAKLPKYTDGKDRNTTFLIDPNGEIVSDYSKVHLCGWVGEDIPFAHGSEIKPVETEIGNLGLLICYDIRFPELVRTHALLGAQALIVPACFSTILEHWKTLLLARAIENQMFVIGCNCCGDGGGMKHVGHSMIIDPLGNIIAEADDSEQVLYGVLDFTKVNTTRETVKYLDDRQPHTYSKKILESNS